MKKNKVTAIVGACGLIGKSLAKDLISEGHYLLLGDVNKRELQKIKNKYPKNVEIYSDDLTKKKNIDKFIYSGHIKFKKIDSIVFSAYPKSRQWGKKFEKIEEKYLKEDLYNQLGSLIIFSQRICKYFSKQNHGNIIFISSIQGLRAPKFEHYNGTKMVSPIEYSAIKAGVISISNYLAKYVKNKNIRVNCVSPGGIRDKQPKLFIKKYRKSCNSVGLLDPIEVSNAIKFLLSNNSNSITGHNLVVDDGWQL